MLMIVFSMLDFNEAEMAQVKKDRQKFANPPEQMKKGIMKFFNKK
jgi:hypothetical protein